MPMHTVIMVINLTEATVQKSHTNPIFKKTQNVSQNKPKSRYKDGRLSY